MCFHVIPPFFSVFNSNYTLPHSYVNLIIEHSYKIFQNIFSLIYLSITSIQILAVRTSIFLRSGLPVSCNPDFQFLAVWISSFWRSRSKVSYGLSSAPFHKIFHIYNRRTIIPLPIPFDQSNPMHTVNPAIFLG